MKVKLTSLLASISLALCTVSAQAQVTLTKKFDLPTQLNGVINTTDCNNNPGPFITLDGTLSLGGLQVQLIFKNNVKGTHTATVTYTTNAQLIAIGDEIVLPKQPPQGGVGGNPHIWIQFFNSSGNLSDEIYLGRCVQGLSISPELLLAAIASADIDVFDCENHPGPFITIGGSLTLSGLNARFIFRNNFKGTHEADVIREISLIADGSVVTIPKQPVQGGAGGNPLISVQFLQGDGTPIGQPVNLGRCVKL